MGKRLLFAGAVGFGLFLFFGTPIGGENFEEINQTLTILIVVVGFVATLGITLLFGSGSNVQIGGRGNSIDASTKHIEIHERAPSGAVRRYTEHKD